MSQEVIYIGSSSSTSISTEFESVLSEAKLSLVPYSEFEVLQGKEVVKNPAAVLLDNDLKDLSWLVTSLIATRVGLQLGRTVTVSACSRLKQT